MKVGIELKIDVTKIEKSRVYQGQKGKYLTMTAFVDLDNEDQYGNNGMITHKKNENEQQSPILGNSKVFWSDAPQQQAPPQQQPQQTYQQPPQQVQQQPPQQNNTPNGFDDFDDDIPF